MCKECALYEHQKGELIGQETINGYPWELFPCKICGITFYEKQNSSERKKNTKEEPVFPENCPR